MQTTLSVALDLLAAAAAPDGTRRAFHLDTIAVSATGTAHPGNGPRSPENAAVPQILELLSHCLSPTTPGSGSPTLAAELPTSSPACSAPSSSSPRPTPTSRIRPPRCSMNASPAPATAPSNPAGAPAPRND
ncbi:hypothetical protein ACFQ9X_14080 [Catenulispora yoronensis]